MRTILVVLVAAATAAGMLLTVPRLQPTPVQPLPIVIQSQGPSIDRLEQLSHLVTTRVCVADVLIGDGEGCRGSWLIRGDALIAVNLGLARITEKDKDNKRASILLPLPEVLQARVDHSRTRTWQVKTTTWIPWIADQDKLRDAVMLQAQQLVAHAAGSAENIQQTKTATEAAIRAFYAEVGWQVKVDWASVPSEGQALVPLPQGPHSSPTDDPSRRTGP